MSTNQIHVPKFEDPLPELRDEINSLTQQLDTVRSQQAQNMKDVVGELNGRIDKTLKSVRIKDSGRFDVPAAQTNEYRNHPSVTCDDGGTAIAGGVSSESGPPSIQQSYRDLNPSQWDFVVANETSVGQWIHLYAVCVYDK
jgi:hypothetical protein